MKRFILFLSIVGIIGVGIFVLTAQEEAPIEPRDTKLRAGESGEASFFELSETMIRNITKDALDARFIAETATHRVADLDHRGGPELIIGTAEQNTATIQVLTVLNSKGEYERVGKIEYQELLREAPEFKELTDIDGDGKDEIIMSLMYGGAASWAEGILDVDFTTKTMRWVQLRDEQGELQDAIFILDASAAHSNGYEILDIDKNGRKEIVEVFTQTILDKTECTANVYEWNGTLFDFSKTLSEQILQRLGEDCAM